MHVSRLLARALPAVAMLLFLGRGVAAQEKESLPAPVPAGSENSASSLERVIGEVTATNPATKQLELKIDAGGTITVILQDRTTYVRVPPGETDLKKAVTITPADIGVGDRLYARGRLAVDRKSIPAVAIIVMTKADLAQTRERERADWQKRGVAGAISALNPETKEITLAVRSKEGTRTLVIESSPQAVFRRYAPDSVRFGQAQPSTFAELRIGDSLRILGNKNAEGTRIKPEEIVAGSFRNIAGIVNAVDAAAGEIRMTDLQSRRQLSVQISPDTMLRRLPAAKAAAPAKPASSPAPAGRSGEGSVQGSAPSAAAASGRQGVASSPASAGRSGEGPARGNAPAAAEAGRGGGGSPAPAGAKPSSGSTPAAAGSGGLTEPEKMPALALRELKREETILVLCTQGTDPSHVTAIVVVAGVEPLLGAALTDQTQVVGPWNFFDIAVP